MAGFLLHARRLDSPARRVAMIVGVIGSGSIGPDLAYGFLSALVREPGSKVLLHDIERAALDSGIERIRGYMQKGVARGKLNPKAAKQMEEAIVTTLELRDLAECDYVLEAASENLEVKKAILKNLEQVVRPDCLIGFATSGIPRAQIAAGAAHPERCFVNHPFFPAWRATAIEVVLSGHEELGERMLATLAKLGKVPVLTADVACFAADDIFVNYCAEAARIVAEGTATPAQVDEIVNEAVGGGGPFNVMDLTSGNLLNIHCLELMRDAPTGTSWFEPPPIFAKQASTPWHDRKNPGNPAHDEATQKEVLERILAVLFARTYFVVDNDICTPRELNWLTRNALGFRAGLLDLAEEYGADAVHAMCTRYAERFDGFEVPASIRDRSLVRFWRNVSVEKDGGVAVVTVQRPEVMNALNDQTMNELSAAFANLAADDSVTGVVLTSSNGALAGADIMELAALKTTREAEEKCLRGQAVLAEIAAMKKPVVAALNGPVLGGGCELSMAAHARVVGKGVMLGQPEVNLGIIPGYGGTQRLPRLIGLERGLDLLRTGRPVGAREACEWGWAHGDVASDPVATAKELVQRHVAGEVELTPVNPEPMAVPGELPTVEIGHHSLCVDAILVRAVRDGLSKPLAEGLKVEAAEFGRCKETIDYGVGMTNFIVNGPRVPAVFLHE
jgi:enoyl-CoA hydratase/3-hydroxyacyl-CoA dehydrogenase